MSEEIFDIPLLIIKMRDIIHLTFVVSGINLTYHDINNYFNKNKKMILQNKLVLGA